MGGPTHDDTIPVDFVRAAMELLVAHSRDPHELLRTAGVSSTLLENPRSRITVTQASTLVHTVWRETGDELFGLGYRAVPRGTFRFLAMTLVHGRDLADVLDRLTEATRIIVGLPRVEVHFGPESTCVRMDLTALNDPTTFLTTLLMAVHHRLLSWLIGRRIDLQLVQLPFLAPADTKDLELVFGSALRFDSPTAAMSFDSRLLTAPVMRDEDAVAGYIAESPGVWLTRRDFGTTEADQVRRILSRGLTGTWPTPDDVATQMSTSAQTLRRRLREQDTSVSQIREELQRDAAIASLVDGAETVAALAERLGFSEPSAFHRAFRRWTGNPPGAYRRR